MWQDQKSGMVDDATRLAAWHVEIKSVAKEESEREERSRQAGMGRGRDRYVLREDKSLIRY